MAVSDLLSFFQSLPVAPALEPIARPLITEIAGRLAYLAEVGLDYLSLSRGTDTLSGGELQRAAGVAARLGLGRRVHDPRRADGRAAPARHGPADRDHSPAAREGQQRRGRRARRVGDPRGRLAGGPWPRRRPRRRPGGCGRHAGCGGGVTGVGHRQVLEPASPAAGPREPAIGLDSRLDRDSWGRGP